MFAAGHTTGTVDHPSIEVTGDRFDVHIANPGIKLGHRDPTASSDSTNVLYVFVGTSADGKAKFSAYEVNIRTGTATQQPGKYLLDYSTIDSDDTETVFTKFNAATT
jgi:hypothetical protein